MEKFKPLKELVKALTYIGDAIAGTNKSSNSQGESNDVYDGILEVADGSKVTYLSFGIKDNDNATKLGDLFSDNFINDLNNAHGAIRFVSTVTKLGDIKIKLRVQPGGPGIDNNDSVFKDGSVKLFGNGTGVDIIIIDDTGDIKIGYATNSSIPFTKDTPLQKINNDDENEA